MMELAESTSVASVAGKYIGTWKIREGMSDSLTPIERKRIKSGEDVKYLDLHENGTFLFRKTTSGAFEMKGEKLVFKPKEFNGTSLESMRAAADQAGRAFGLAWLFDPFELVSKGETLETADPRALIYVEYQRLSVRGAVER